MDVILWMVIILGLNFGVLVFLLWRLVKKKSS